MTRARLGQPQRERADAAEQVGDRACALRNAPTTSRASVGFAGRGRLQEGAGRQRPRARGPSSASAPRAAPPVSPWRVRRARRCRSATRASAVVRRRQRAGAAHVDIEAGRRSRSTWMSSGLRGRRRALRRSPRRPRSRRRAPAPAPGSGRSATIVMRAQRGEADLEHVVRAAPRMQHRAPAALAVRVDQIVDRRVESRPAPAPRPPDRASRRDMRRRAQCCSAQPPQIAEMRADRRDALGARLDRRAADAGGRDGRATARPSTVSPGSV